MTTFLQEPTVNIGIDETNRREIADGLRSLLADTYTLYLKTQNFHWNVTGPMFQTLHLLFEQQYQELALAIDLIAERIRALGVIAPGSFREFARLATVADAEVTTSAEQMIQQLLADQETVVRTVREVFSTVAQARDEATAELLTQRLGVHEKNAWMLRSLLSLEV